ncbi:transcriptional regulator [Vibrio cyclitrophicus]|uniref:transcriptional regulator n=1 Tax=Vibrio cyclitrophicus TaxID=47951 RepID=UPI00030329C6|nr:transcriptional regulator [Vibrio cyclitrophicus]OEF47885.1 hypothetical protein OAC_18430 [Vibrio cyclitrophicus 1F273]
MTDKSIIGANIERRMKELGIKTNKELSDLSGVSRAVITNVQLNPSKKLMAESAIWLANALQCRPEWFVFGKGPVNLDEVEKANRLRFGAPVVSVNELVEKKPKELLLSIATNEDRQRHPCPAGNAATMFIIKSSQPIGEFPAGGMYFFDYDLEPSSNQLVIAVPDVNSTPEIMVYFQARGKKFLKSLVEDLPIELRTIEITEEMEILATFRAFAIV